MKNFKIRCSQIGKIMGKKGLGKTGESYLETWLKEQMYSRKKEFSSKYTEKGNSVELENISFVSSYLGGQILIKNYNEYEDEFITGTPDIITDDKVIDIKSSWDCFTFPLFDKELENKDYYWQAQGYMHLANKESAIIAYVLSDTPDNIIEKEAYFYCKNNGLDELDFGVYEDFVKKMTYKNIPDNFKIKTFNIQKNEKDIEEIILRVEECRSYLDKIKIVE